MNHPLRPAHLLLLGLFFWIPVYGYILQTSVSSVDQQTRSVRWPYLPQDFVVDGGTLGGGDGITLILNALDAWDNVPTAQRLGGDLFVYTDGQGHPLDFNDANFGIDYGIIGDGVNEIVFDETGAVLELLGLDPASVAGIGITIENPADQRITDALLILNGTFPSSIDLDMESTAVHELGHIWGLGHTFIGAINTANGVAGLYPIHPVAIPTMYPYVNPVDDRYGRTLEWDDYAGISWLYPETAYAPPGRIPFGSDTGRLRGKATYRDQIPLTAVHVRAVNVDQTDVQIACLSGYAADGSGSFDIADLPPGRYTLVAESIDGRDDISAANIEDDGIGCCILDGFADLASPTPVTVAAAQTLSGFQFDIPSLPLSNDDAVELGLPADVPFSLAGMPVRRVFLYSNGYLGFHRFEDPDPAMTLPGADLLDFLSRPVAKLCPLRLDLDPEGNADRRVDVTSGGGQVTFSFTDQRVAGTAGRATCRVILRHTGDFRYEYGNITAGSALIGYTAGVFAAGGQEGGTDLTAYLGGTVPTAHDTVKYQLLPAVALANSSLDFPKPATDPFPVRNRLIYPWLAHNPYFDLGLAVVSNSNYSARLRVTALSGDGRPLPVNAPSQNPVIVTLGPFAQFVTQIGQLFDFQGGTADGWVLVETDNPDPVGIQGFFLAQSFFDGTMDSLDGAVALFDLDRTLVFPRYTGGTDDFTEVTVVNPNPAATDITLHLYFEDGSEIVQNDTLPANGAGIFQLAESGSAYVLVDATEPVAGFAMNFNLAGSLAGQPGRYLWESRSDLVSPHFVYSPGSFASRLDLVNPNNQAATVTATLHDAAGGVIGHPVQITIDGWYNRTLEIDPATFGFPSASLADGWIGLSANQPVLGAMTFGEPGYALYQSTLPLLGWPTYGTLNAHLAQGNAGGIDYLTGLAVLSLDGNNPFALDVYDSAGAYLGGVQDTLGTDERAIGLLNEWLPDGPWPRVSGYLTGAADRGAYVYEIFTTDTAEFFAAVPAQKYLPLQTEADDENNGWTDAAEPLSGFPVELRGQLSALDTGYFLMDLGDGYTDEIEDLFLFDAPRSGWYILGLFPDNRYCDVDLYLFDSQWNIVASSANGVPGVEYIEVELQPGTYGIGVSLYDLGWFDTGGYYLSVEPDAIF
jgi:hypothetical protein